MWPGPPPQPVCIIMPTATRIPPPPPLLHYLPTTLSLAPHLFCICIIYVSVSDLYLYLPCLTGCPQGRCQGPAGQPAGGGTAEPRRCCCCQEAAQHSCSAQAGARKQGGAAGGGAAGHHHGAWRGGWGAWVCVRQLAWMRGTFGCRLGGNAAGMCLSSQRESARYTG
jgi:hypothetical protein